MSAILRHSVERLHRWLTAPGLRPGIRFVACLELDDEGLAAGATAACAIVTSRKRGIKPLGAGIPGAALQGDGRRPPRPGSENP
jgi:hypothetical protein